MKKIFKFFLFDLKRTFLVPAIAVVLYIINAATEFGAMGRDLLSFSVSGFEKADKAAEIYLYIFCGLILASLIYRTVTDDKLFKKARIDPKTVFLSRLFSAAVFCFLFATFALLLGTARLAKLKNRNEDMFYVKDYPFIFSLFGKRGTYMLFGLSVGFSVAVAYSFVFMIHQAITSDFHPAAKVAFIAALAAVGVFALFVPYRFVSVGNVGTSVYGAGLPVGNISYAAIRNFTAAHYYQQVLPSPVVIKCAVCWNILHIPALVVGAAIIILGFLSHSFFSIKENADYIYGGKKK